MTLSRHSDDDRELGLDTQITRKDFLNATILGVGGLLLSSAAPGFARAAALSQGPSDDFTGFGGTGDYAKSNGNTKAVLDAGHRVRDGVYAKLPATTADTGEFYDVVIVGGGIAGLAAAYTLAKTSDRKLTCLVIENHPIFGGGAKQNEFIVNGNRLIGPQASNQFGVPGQTGTSITSTAWTDFGLPRSFSYQDVDPSVGGLRIPLDNYAHMDGVNETQVDVGYFFDQRSGASKPMWLRNIWQNDLADAPFAPEVRADLLRWRNTSGETTDEFRRRLDTMTYAQYLEGVLKLRPEVTAFVAPVVGLINGAGPDAVSAFAASQIGMPGVARVRSRTGPLPQSFPGGNAFYAQHFVKYLVPDGFSGAPGLEGVHTGRVHRARSQGRIDEDSTGRDRRSRRARKYESRRRPRVGRVRSRRQDVSHAGTIGGDGVRRRHVARGARGHASRHARGLCDVPARTGAGGQRRTHELEIPAHARRALRALVRR